MVNKSVEIGYFKHINKESYMFLVNDLWTSICIKHNLFSGMPQLSNLRFQVNKAYNKSITTDTNQLAEINLELEFYLLACLGLNKKK